MAKRKGEATLASVPPPRETSVLFGHPEAEDAFATAIGAGRLHHAWLIGGPEGVGKATLAYRVARVLLARPDERTGASGLAVDPRSRTARQVAAGSHPNLLTIDLDTASADVDKPPAKTIPIRTVRRALSFFGSTAADGGHRVCIVDAIDDMLLPGVNALLKTVEEPPARATVLIVSHAPQRVLPTIRSRCRKIVLAPLGAADLKRIATAIDPSLAGNEGDPGATALDRAVAVADGSVRRTLSLLDPDRMALVDDVASLLALLPEVPMQRVLALAERLSDRRGDDNFDLALDAVLRWASERVGALAALGPRRLAPLAELCEKVAEAAIDVETYNLDRRPFVISMFGDLAEAVRRAA